MARKSVCSVTEKFANIDLHPETVDNYQMGLVFEELIRKFAELSNETAGEHYHAGLRDSTSSSSMKIRLTFTPRKVIRLMDILEVSVDGRNGKV